MHRPYIVTIAILLGLVAGWIRAGGHNDPVLPALSATQWLETKGFTFARQIQLTRGGTRTADELISQNNFACRVLVVPSDTNSDVLGLLEQQIDPHVWQARRIWHRGLHDKGVSTIRLTVSSLLARLAHPGRPRSEPALVLVDGCKEDVLSEVT
jgi:hypothetical protein